MLGRHHKRCFWKGSFETPQFRAPPSFPSPQLGWTRVPTTYLPSFPPTPRTATTLMLNYFPALLVEANKRRHKKKAKGSRRTETRVEEERKRKRYLKVKTHRKARKEKKRAEWGKRKMSLSLSVSFQHASSPPPWGYAFVQLKRKRPRARSEIWLNYSLFVCPPIFLRFWPGLCRGFCISCTPPKTFSIVSTRLFQEHKKRTDWENLERLTNHWHFVVCSHVIVSLFPNLREERPSSLPLQSCVSRKSELE